jgi:uncharacterized protein (DUF1499 family)
MPRFEACNPASQKCVSTRNDVGYPAFEPVPFLCTPEEAMAAVHAVIAEHPRTKIIADDGLYLSTQFITRVIRWKDTVQFEVDADANVIHFRSDSVPYAGSDFGANRKRMDLVAGMLRAKLG